MAILNTATGTVAGDVAQIRTAIYGREVRASIAEAIELLDSSVKLMDGKSPLEIQLPGPLNALKKPVLHVIQGTVIEKLLRDHQIIKDGMM